METSVVVNGVAATVLHDARVTLLDALRDHVGDTSVKKGCDHGQCGACTVLADGRRTLSCLALLASYRGCAITTASGIGAPAPMSDLQRAFIERDALQCGYCTPGQVCSAEGMLAEARGGMPSHVTADVADVSSRVRLTREEIRERMSGNLCRCGAHPGIVAAVEDVARQRGLTGAGPSQSSSVDGGSPQ